ncbi:MAG: hypothetical protein HOW73_24015 [Polyangiaceae bacterium]|nr:hypothetical protein [Polyangiaceae bacterium]
MALAIMEFGRGEVQLWVPDDGGAVHLRAVTQGDPVELSAEEARAVAKALLELAEMVE